jgi:hypothetical protein
MSHTPARGQFLIELSHLKLLSLDVARGAVVRSFRRGGGFAYRKDCERARRVQ